MAGLIDAECEALRAVNQSGTLKAEQFVAINRTVSMVLQKITNLEEALCCKMKNALNALCDPCNDKGCDAKGESV